MIARVRLVMRLRISSGSMLPSDPISASTGVAPTCRMACTVAQNVIGVVITSSPGPIFKAGQREVQRGRRGIHGDGVRRADILAEFTLEASRARAGCQPPGPQGLHNFVDLFFADRGAMKGDEISHHVRLLHQRFS